MPPILSAFDVGDAVMADAELAAQISGSVAQRQAGLYLANLRRVKLGPRVLLAPIVGSVEQAVGAVFALAYPLEVVCPRVGAVAIQVGNLFVERVAPRTVEGECN
jgi:hypothetical protein